MNLVSFSDLFFDLIGGVQSRSFDVRFKAINIEFQFIRNNHIQTFLLQLFQLRIQKIFLSLCQFLLFFNSGVYLFLKLLLLLLSVFESFFFHCVFDKIFCFVNYVHYFAIGRSAHNFDISHFLKILTKLSKIFPLRMIEFQKLFFLHKFIIQLLQIFRLPRILGLQHLYKPALKLFGSPLDMFQRIAGILPNFLLMTWWVNVTFESVFIFALFSAQLAEMFQSRRHWFNFIIEDELYLYC